MRINGYDVIVSHWLPGKISISQSFEWISDKGRLSMNLWLRNMFGESDDVFVMDTVKKIVMSPRQFANLQKEATE